MNNMKVFNDDILLTKQLITCFGMIFDLKKNIGFCSTGFSPVISVITCSTGFIMVSRFIVFHFFFSVTEV